MIEVHENSDGGAKGWYLNGTLHRINGPAVTWADGDFCWISNGVRHRYYGCWTAHGEWIVNGVKIK